MESITQIEEEGFPHPVKDESDEISRKRFEKGLLVKYQTSISLLQERKISEGISMLHDLLNTDEINNLKIPNQDYEKLKAACHLNLYKAYSETKQHRKSFYFMIKYLDYERDNYQMSYEFGAKLFSEGFLSGALIYFKRALSFAIARTEPEFSELILDKLVTAMCMLDEPSQLQDLLLNIETQKIFKNSDISKYWNRYHAYLKTLNTEKGFKNLFAEKIEAYESEHGMLDITQVHKIRSMRQSIKSKIETLQTESAQLIIQQIRKKPETQIQTANPQKISPKLTLNSILGKMTKSLETYSKPVRKEYNFANFKREKNSPKSDSNQAFFNRLHNETFIFESEKKAAKENNGVDEKPKFTIVQKVFENNLGTESESTSEYLLGLLKHICLDHPTFFIKDSHLTHGQLVINSKNKTVFAIREKFYQNMISECNNKSIISAIITFMEINFSERIREYRNNGQVVCFLGPSYFLREDFFLNKKEIFAIFNFVFSFFKRTLDFESLLIFLECYLALAEPNDFRNTLTSLKKQAQYLKQCFNQLEETFYVDKANRYITYLQQVSSSNNLFDRIFDVDSQIFGCENESCTNHLEGLEKRGLCENCLRVSTTEAYNQTPVFNWLVNKIKSDIQKRLELIVNILCFDDAQICNFSKIAHQNIFLKSNLTPLPGYWCQQRVFVVTTQNFQALFNNIAQSFSYNDFEFISMFLQLNFHGLYSQLETINDPWVYLSKLIAFLFVLIRSQAASDNKILEGFFELIIRVFQLPEAIKFTFKEIKTRSLEKFVCADKELILQVYKMIILLFSCANNTGNSCLQMLVRLMLRVYWKIRDYENYIIFFQFINTFNEFSIVKQNLNDILFTSSTKTRFLISSLSVLQKFPEEDTSSDAQQKLAQLNLRLYLLEISRHIDFTYGIKIATTQLFNFFKSKLNKQNENAELKGFLDQYKLPGLKLKMHNLSLASESENKETNLFYAKLLTEQFLVFKLYCELSNCLENVSSFLFNVKEKDTGFGENRCFSDRSLRVHSSLDFKILNTHFTKIEKLLKSFENLGNLGEVFRTVVCSQGLLDGVLTKNTSSDQMNGDNHFDFYKNPQMFVFLVLLVRFQESVHIEQPTKTNEEGKNFNYKMISCLYQYLQSRNPFGMDNSLHPFFEDSCSRSAMISSFVNNEYEFASIYESSEPEICENHIITALVNRLKIQTQIGVLEACNATFDDLVEDQILYGYGSHLDKIDEYLGKASEFIIKNSTKRIDYLLVFYFPNQLTELSISSEDILKKIDNLFKSLAQTTTLERYHLNFKSGIDFKQAEKAHPLRIIGLASIINAKYRHFFFDKPTIDTDRNQHVRLADKLLFDLHEKHNSVAKYTDLANGQISLLRQNENNPGGQQSLPDYFKQIPNSRVSPSDHVSFSNGDSSVQIVSDFQNQRGSNTPPSEVNTLFYQNIKPLYEELFKLLENKPKSFDELWASVFTLVYEFSPKERRNLSPIFNYNISEIVFSVKAIFTNIFSESQYPLNFLEHFKKFDIIDREKDFKIYHCDSTLMRNFVFYFRLFDILKCVSPLRLLFLISSVKLLKRVDIKSDDLFLANLLFPLAKEFEENSPISVDLVRSLWDARVDTAKLNLTSTVINRLYKFVMKKCYMWVLKYVEQKLPTEEDRQELNTHFYFMNDQSLEVFDLEASIKKERSVKSNIKKYFEDKVTMPLTDQKPNGTNQVPPN